MEKNRPTVIQNSVEELFVKHAVECKEPGQHSSDKTVSRLRERYVISKSPPTAKKSRPYKRCVVC
jgi:hypothetical protein